MWHATGAGPLNRRRFILVALLLTGCGHRTFAYRPDAPRSAENRGTATHLLYAEAGVDGTRWLPLLSDPDRRLVSATAAVTFELPPLVASATVTGAWWAGVDLKPCSGGIPASGAALDVLTAPVPLPVEVDDFRVWRLQFERGADAGGLPSERSVVDLQVETEGRRACLRLPFTRLGGEADWGPFTDWFLGVGMRAHYFILEPRTYPGADLGTVTLAVGRWTSKTTRVFVEPGYSENGAPGAQVSLGVHHEKVFVRRGKFAVGVTAGYVAMALPGRFGADGPWLLHGPEFALRLKETLPESIGGGFPGLLQDAAAELILPVNVWFGHGTQTRALGFTVGWGIAFH